MKHQIITTKTDIEQEIKRLAKGDDLENLDHNDDIGAVVDNVYHRLNSFSYIEQSELEQQLADYDDAYLGSNAKTGELIWFDGECCCKKECVKYWFESEQPENGVYYSWQQYGDFALNGFVLQEFDTAQNTPK